MNLDRFIFFLVCLLAFTINLENFFNVFFGINTPFELYRLIALALIVLLLVQKHHRRRWDKADRLIFFVFSWGAMMAIIRFLFAFVNIEAMAVNYILFGINFFMFYSLKNFSWTLSRSSVVILWYNAGLLANLLHFQVIGVETGPNVDFARAAGFFSNPNSLALACLFGILGCFFVFICSSKAWMRYLSVVFFLIDFYVLNQTSSRAGAIIAGLLLLLITIWYYYTQRRIVSRFVMVTTVVLVYLFSGSFTIGALERQRSREDRQVKEEREALTQAGLDAFVDTKFMGLGLGQFKEINNFYKYVYPYNAGIANVRRQKNEGLVTHNSYIQILAEIGAVGFFALIGFWFSVLSRAINNRKINRHFFFFQIGIIGIGIIYSIGHVIYLAPNLWFCLSFIFPLKLYKDR
ncbi:MAG: O-antigen ligase family protein [Cyclobacteriaceae bacterium]